MKNFLSLIIILFFSNSIFAQFTPKYNFKVLNNNKGQALCKSFDGGYILFGTTHYNDTRSNDYYLINLSHNYDTVFTKTYGHNYQDVGRDIIQTRDSCYILLGESYFGYRNRLNGWIIKIDLEGNIIWENENGDFHTEQLFSIKEVSSGGYIAIGYTRSFDDIGDFWVIKIDENGKKIWSKNFGTNALDYGMDIIEIEDGNFLLLGSKGGFFNYNQMDFLYDNPSDILLIKIDEHGNEIWQKTYGGEQNDMGQKIIKAKDNGYYILSSSQSFGAKSFDIAILKINEQYELEWVKNYGGTNFQYASDFTYSHDSAFIYTIGTTSNTTNKYTDAFVIETDLQGNLISSRAIGDKYSDYGYSIISDVSGYYILGESFNQINSNFFFKPVKIYSEPEEQRFNFNVYPNPATDKINFFVETNLSQEINTLQIYNSFGKLQGTYKIYNQNILTINILNYKPGIYFAQIITSDIGSIYKKFVVY